MSVSSNCIHFQKRIKKYKIKNNTLLIYYLRVIINNIIIIALHVHISLLTASVGVR